MEISTQKPSLTPRFFFISLGVIIALITSVSSFLMLFFETLDKKFPDALTSTFQYGYNSYSYDSIRSSLATLIIFFPVFLVLAYYWRKLSKSELGIKDNIIFKWMIYLIIFLASLLVVIDLVTLVNYFVSGEITIRFIYKVIGVAIMSGLIGFNYFFELRDHDNKEIKNKFSIIYTSISLVMFLGLIIWSFAIMGSPAQQRIWRLDDTRISDLQNIQSQVITFWQQKEKLPLTLVDVANPTVGFILPVDPEFEKGLRYEYTPKDALSFELCATFGAEMPKGWQESTRVAYPMQVSTDGYKNTIASPYPSGVNDSWAHNDGRTCFTRTIDKDIYRPIKN
jgi:hypothetical protein